MNQMYFEWSTTIWNPVTSYTLISEQLEEPLKWKKHRRVLVCSTGDLFYKSVEEKFIAKIFAIMDLAKQHTYYVLTKYPERAFRLLTSEDFQFYIGWFQSQVIKEFKLPEPKNIEQWQWPFSNVWVGVTAENQEMANKRIPILLQIPAAIRFVSCNPLLGPIDLTRIAYDDITVIDALRGLHGMSLPHIKGLKLNLVIVGNETSLNTQPCHSDWVRILRNQCKVTNTAFFYIYRRELLNEDRKNKHRAYTQISG